MRCHRAWLVLWALLLATVLSACGGYQIALVTVTPEGGAPPPPVASLAATPLPPEPTATEATPYPAWMATLAPTLTSAPVVAPSDTAAPTEAPSATAEPTYTTGPTATESPVPITAVPSATPPPTATLTATPLPAAERVSFAVGATAAVVTASVPANGMRRFVLWAGARQMLEVNVASDKTITLRVQGSNGTLLYEGAGLPGYRGNLPLSQDYFLTLTTGAEPANLTMNIVIPVRVAFARGTTAGSVDGVLPAHGANYYVLGAQGGQLLDVNLVPSPGLTLSVHGLDGAVVINEAASFRGLLPSTQDYVVTVRTGSSAASYTLNVSIPERVRFASGATSVSREARLGVRQQHAYVLGARAGQQLHVVLATPEDTMRISIWGVDGTVLMSGMGGGYEFSGSLP
ncbi:MAG: hypothetical protein GX557_15580, partial [Chloroflexi bacterium]|nr:hypothetical protein [Chloroflexota bacterium]